MKPCWNTIQRTTVTATATATATLLYWYSNMYISSNRVENKLGGDLLYWGASVGEIVRIEFC